ncbi:hypothetical protein RLOC_00003319 [Lonchura striata]|uniref:Uncharacterized protein n=1 Tax=Lonchura striata TaxID=40157 RepID=A0A218UUM9_9PASE|nr:hypothetical protein RLOC_00003319 [Lonchura striata domestica]
MVQPRSPVHLSLNSSPVPSCSHWPLALPSVKSVLRPLAAAASFLYWWCQSRVAQMAHPKSPSPARLSAANSFDEK